VLDTPPSPVVDNLTKIADFVEIDCLRRNDLTISHEDLVQIMVREHEIDDETLRTFANDVFAELERRQTHAGKAGSMYPYHIEKRGSLLRFNKGDANEHWLYLFLLLATRLNMKSDRNHAELDGTQLFEQLCAVVADRFWGGPCAEVKAEVFGTGRVTTGIRDDAVLPKTLKFGQRVDDLCKFLGEGAGFGAKHEDRVTARDGKLDIIVVRQFADMRNGQLIGFGQCKTGTHWTNDLTKLRPAEFARKWMIESPAVEPVRMYFVADRVKLRWINHCIDGGVLFDRCRILEYSREIPRKLFREVVKWSKAAAKSSNVRIR